MAGHHEDLSRVHEVQASSNRSFGLWVGSITALIGLAPMFRGGAPRIWAMSIAIFLLVAAAIAPAVLSPLNSAWTRFGLLIGRVMNPVITALIFVLIITPAGLVVRWLGKDPLRLRPDPGAASYWIRRDPPGPEPGTMMSQF